MEKKTGYPNLPQPFLRPPHAGRAVISCKQIQICTNGVETKAGEDDAHKVCISGQMLGSKDDVGGLELLISCPGFP